MVPLKYLSNFFRSLEMPLVNCKIHLELNWNNNCVMYGADTYAGNLPECGQFFSGEILRWVEGG